MSYKPIALNNERQHNRKYFSGGEGFLRNVIMTGTYIVSR